MKAELNSLGSAGFEELVQALVEGVAGFEARIYGEKPNNTKFGQFRGHPLCNRGQLLKCGVTLY